MGEVFGTNALAVLSIQVTGSAMAAALVFTVHSAAIFVVSIFAGYFIDAIPKRAVMISSDVLRAALLPLFLLLDADSFWIAYPLVFATSSLSSIFHPARESLIQTLFTGDERLRAVAKIQGTLAIINLVGPSIARIMVSLLGTDGAFLLNSIGFLLSAFILRSIPSGVAVRQAKQNLISVVASGWVYLFKNRWLRRLTLVRTGINLSFGVYRAALYPILLSTQESMHAQYPMLTFAVALGVINSMEALGSLVGAFVVSRYRSRLHGRYPAMVAASVAIISVGMMLWSTDSFRLLLVGSGLTGVGLVLGRTGIISIGQAVTDPEYMGRAISAGNPVTRFALAAAMGAGSFIQAAALASPSAVILAAVVIMITASGLPMLRGLTEEIN